MLKIVKTSLIIATSTLAFSNTAQAISKRILVADDNKVIRNAVAWFLEFMGFEVALAANSISDCFGGCWGGAVVD